MLSAQADISEAISRSETKSLSESNELTSEECRFKHNNVSDLSQNANESQQELPKSNQAQMQLHMKAPPVMMDSYQHSMIANTMRKTPQVEVQKEPEVSGDELLSTANKSQELSWKHSRNATEHWKDCIVPRNRCAQPTNHATRTVSLGDEKVPRRWIEMDKCPQDSGIAVDTRSETRWESGSSMLATQNLDDVPALLSITDENKKNLYRSKPLIAYAPPGEPQTRRSQAMQASIPPDVQPGIAMTQTFEETPGAYSIVPGSTVQPTRLLFGHEMFSGLHDSDEASHPAQGHLHDEIFIDDGEIGTNENNPVEAEAVQEVFAKVVVWYKRPMYRWILLAGVVLVVAIIILGVRLRTTSSPPTLAPTMVDAESIACSFLDLSIDVCRETTLVDASPPWSTIPTELGVLTQLTSLSLYSRRLNGTIPSEIGAMTSLTYLELSSNHLTGTIPTEIGTMTSLTFIDLSENQLSGNIPTEIGIMTSLVALDLSDNQLIRFIPLEVGAMVSLLSLSLSNNQLTGTIPSKMGTMTRLTSLEIDSNRLTGTIPKELGALTGLVVLFIDSNQLTGTIPSAMATLNRLGSLDISENQLTGTIPPEMGAMTSLTLLHLWGNRLTSIIPSEIGTMTSLTGLILDLNALSGTIPSEIGTMTSLTSLILDLNFLNGTIPSGILTLTNLADLKLSDNRLSGTIPSGIMRLTNLADLKLSNNGLSGTIPSGMWTLTTLTNLDLSLNLLTGTIPSEFCQYRASIYIDCATIECICCSSGDLTPCN